MTTVRVANSVAMIATAVMATSTRGEYTITQGDVLPTYGTTLNFDEPGGPIGVVSPDAWLTSHGIVEVDGWFDSVDPEVGDWSVELFPWIGSGNSLRVDGGAFIRFENDLTELSFNVWAMPPGPFGQMVVALLNDGESVASGLFTAPWGGSSIGTAFDIATTGGMVFDEVQISAGFKTVFLDDMSWNVVPAPGVMAMLAVAALARRTRRRG